MSSIPSASDSRLSSLLAKPSTSSDKPGPTDPSFLASDTRFVGGDNRFETILGTLDNVMSTAGSEADDVSFTGGERSFSFTSQEGHPPRKKGVLYTKYYIFFNFYN